MICTASIEDRVPHFLRGSGTGWVSAEYAMIPRATSQRTIREASKGHPSGRTQEIQRLIGRALRSVCRLDALGERTIWIDCDVIQADGGTRTASITGAFVALADALVALSDRVSLKRFPLETFLAAVSVGIIEGEPRLDLSYEEDSAAQVDFNVVMTGRGEFVELQGTAEQAPFARQQLDELLILGERGVAELIALQRTTLSAAVIEKIERKASSQARTGERGHGTS